MSDTRDVASVQDEQEDEEERELMSAVTSPAPVVTRQAYRSVFNQTIAPPPYGPLTRVVHPPVDFPPESKRAQLIEDAETDLELDMEELERAVHDANADFQRRIDDVKARGRSLETQLRSEYEAMEESMNQLVHAFRSGFETAFHSLEQRTLSHFARVETEDVAAQEASLREGDADARQFFYTTVPAIMESLQGAITRKLAKHHESFDIENAKTQKRELKTLAMMDVNEQSTLRLFRTERERRHGQFRDHEEACHHTMRVDNRTSETQQRQYVETLVSLRAQLTEETRVRQQEDLDVLDKLSESFHRLQASVLENLGDDAESAAV